MAQRTKLSDAVWTAFTEAIRYVVIPLVLVNLIVKNYPQLTTAFMPNITEYTVIFGGMIVAASAMEAYHRPGTYQRMLFGLSTLAFIGLWLFVIFGGGLIEFSYGPYLIRFDMSKIVLIMIAGIALRGMLVVQTYRVNKRVIEERERKEMRERVREQRAAEAAREAAAARAEQASFSAMSKADFQVTADNDVGFKEPSAVPAAESAGTRYKTCGVCGERAPASSYVCMNCGAWFSKESFRFGKENPKNR